MHIKVLGAIEALDGTGRTVELPRRARQVLGFLAARHDRLQSKDAIADAVWGDELPGNHVATLEHYVSVLRRGLQPGARTAESFIVTRGGGYLLSTQRVALDLAELRRWVREADTLDPGRPERLALRERIVALSGEPPYPDEEAQWAAAVRLEVREAALAALLDLAEAYLPVEPGRALRLARQANELDGYLEQPYRIGMRAAAALGRLDDVLRWYDRCRRTLADELGIEPSDETVALHAELVAPRRLRPLLAVLPDAGPDPVPLASVGFAGREAELYLILGSPPVRTVHLVGPPGAGKTALLAELARRAPGRVGTGSALGPAGALRLAWLHAALTGLGAPAGVLAVVDRAMAQRRALSGPELAELAGVLDRAEPVVLGIDEAQELDAESVTELTWLRERCPLLSVVPAYRYPRALTDRPLARLPADLVLRLAPLGIADVGEHAYERSGGIPALVPAVDRPTEVARAMAMQVARLRTAWMPPDAWDLLRLCATLGTLRVEQLAALTGRPLADVLRHVDQLVHAHLLAEGPGGHVRHRSGLIRDAVAEQVSAAHASHLRRLLDSA